MARKYALELIVVIVLMGALALLPLLLPASILQTAQWKIVVVAIWLVAIALFAYRGMIVTKEDRERDARFGELLASQNDGRQSPDAARPQGLLGDRLRQAAIDLFAFLKERGPLPDAGITPGMNTREKLARSWPMAQHWANATAFGYEHRFRSRIEDLVAEVRERGLNPAIADYEFSPPHGHSADSIRVLAEKLGLLSVEADKGDCARPKS